MKFSAFIAIAAVVCTPFFVFDPSSAQPDNAWHPICVRRPSEITNANKATVKGEDCKEIRKQLTYQNNSQTGTLYVFRDGGSIQYFFTEEPRRFSPNRVMFSINEGDWTEGVYELPSSTIYQCGNYKCNWVTIRDNYGKLVLATGMSY